MDIFAASALALEFGAAWYLRAHFSPFVGHGHVGRPSDFRDRPSGDTSSLSFSCSRSQANMAGGIDGTYLVVLEE